MALQVPPRAGERLVVEFLTKRRLKAFRVCIDKESKSHAQSF